VPLNANGRDQARRARDLLGGLEIATVCSSPLERALETAALLQVSLGCGLKVLDDLAECCWGEREGQVKGQWFEDWKLGRRTPDGAEPYACFLVRALRGILDSEFDIPNAVPVRHDPPKPDYPWWTATVLEADR
jgi:probable phosphoglycerate mutase